VKSGGIKAKWSLHTAKLRGLTILPGVLAIADAVIE
jgi:hypothetical protein